MASVTIGTRNRNAKPLQRHSRQAMSSRQVEAYRQRVPLVIGVTGHRDPICDDALSAAIRSVLTEINGKCPHTPLIVLSALADGADRLVAQIACDEFEA